MLIERAGCPNCRVLYGVNFVRPEIADYVKAHFLTVQLDLWGAQAVVDFDGLELEERQIAQKWRANFTPTTLFFSSTSGAPAEIFCLPGLLKPFRHLASTEYVAAGAYLERSFQRFLQDKLERLRAQGIEPDVW